MSHSFLQLPA